MRSAIVNADQLLTLDPAAGEGSLGAVPDGAVAWEGDRIVFAGPSHLCPEVDVRIEARGRIVMPALVDCHTHSLFAGTREPDFRRRLAGASYSEILEQGGGILSTVRATRAASDEELSEVLAARLDGMRAGGVATVEVKSGYGLDPEQEIRHLRLLRRGSWPVEVAPTFLGAHAIPAEWRHDREGWMKLLLGRILPEAAELALMVDVYCDRGAYTLEEARAVLEAGMARGMVGRIHAEQVQRTGAAELAAELGCASADHLEQIDDAGVAALARGGVVAGLLPGAMLYLRDRPPPVARLREAGVRMAVATDFNPGSSPVRDLWSCASLACVAMGLTVEEAVTGITRNAARAIFRTDLGALLPGFKADIAVFRPPPGEPADVGVLVQYMGGHKADLLVQGGRL